jgi:hypothetical protein
MTVKEHLGSLHLRHAEHHIEQSKHHLQLGKHFGKLAEAFGKSEMGETHAEAGECLQKIADAHKGMAEHHAGEADYHTKCAKTLRDSQKTMMSGDDDLDALAPMPTGFSRVVPTPANLRAIPRHGQREISVPVAPVFDTIYGGSGTDEGD